MAIAYILFYVFDAAVLSRDAIAASTHLVLFIAVYQPIEALRADNRAQRLLTASLIFVAGVATSTHITIVLYVIVFTFLMFRQLMHISHVETVQAIGREFEEPPSARAAGFYLCSTAMVGALLFPLLPRVRNPLLQGFAGALTNASTGLSDSIDFNSQRSISPDPAVVSRVWMGQEAIPFFTPLRLRGAVYDRFVHNEWKQTRGYVHREVTSGSDGFRIAQPLGFSRAVTVQQRFVKGTRLFLPSGTYSVSGLPQLFEGPTEGTYFTFQARQDVTNFRADLSREIAPLRSRPVAVGNYPTSPEVRAMALQIVGRDRKPLDQAADIERYMSTKFRYVPDPSQIGHVMSVDAFLLREHRGHCEYFAAGMVALMTALDVPAHIVGGFYGGRFNPLTGYFVIRREDAHAWVEVWDGGKWVTFDSTPAALRPGSADGGLLNLYASALGDSINYFWDRYILTFGLGDQVALAVEGITRMRGAVSWMHIGAIRAKEALASMRAMAGLAFIAVVAVLAIVAVARRRRSLFDLLAAHLEALGIIVGSAMTMEEALQELRDTRPDAARDLEPLIALYDAERFSPGEDRRRRSTIRKRLTELRTG